MFELPEGYLVSWDRTNGGAGIRWSLWFGDEKVGSFELGDALFRQGTYGKDARQVFWDLAEEHLSMRWDERIDAASRRALPPIAIGQANVPHGGC